MPELEPLNPPEHPEIPAEQDRVERGDDPDPAVGDGPEVPDEPDPDPAGQPEAGHADDWRHTAVEIGGEGRKPRREQVYPYLLIRALAAGDRGARPVFPPAPFWESPDILLIDAAYDGPFDPLRLVASPRAGRSYRVFVRVWNLGLLPAAGVHVMGWAVNPGFIGAGNQDDPYYQQNLIGGSWLELSDRTRPDCLAIAELDRPWDIPPGESGHYCLLAQVECPMDTANGSLLPNVDRHVGQRNVEVLAGGANPTELINRLGSLVPERFALEITHAGPAVRGNLQAWGGGVLPDATGDMREVTVPELNELRFGVPTSTSRHLLTAFVIDGRTGVVESGRLATAATEILGAAAVEGMFERPGGAWHLLEELGPARWADIGTVNDQPLGESLARRMSRVLEIDGEFRAALVARRLGGPPGAQHALRFTLSAFEGDVVGGYTVVVS